jgi:hypothetical protein
MFNEKSAATPKLGSDERGDVQLTEDEQMIRVSFDSRNLFDDSNMEDAAWLLIVRDQLKRKR